jgi:hypothetical protein
MPIILGGLFVLAAVGGLALWAQHGTTTAAAPLPNSAGAGGAFRTDAVAAPTVVGQTVSPAEQPTTSYTDPRTSEAPDRFADSPAATTSPVSTRTVQGAFADYTDAALNDDNAGYKVDDLAESTIDPAWSLDDINAPRDLAQAPGSASGLIDAEWK